MEYSGARHPNRGATSADADRAGRGRDRASSRLGNERSFRAEGGVISDTSAGGAMLRSLLKRKPKVPAKFYWGLDSHMRGACCGNDVETAREILNLGLSPNTGMAPHWNYIHLAAIFGSIELIDLLLAYGADPLIPRPKGGYDRLPSGCARSEGRHDIADYLKTIEDRRIAAILAAGGRPPKIESPPPNEDQICAAENCPYRPLPFSEKLSPPQKPS
jgi:hypothetical protein